jgi:hypothetical protein
MTNIDSDMVKAAQSFSMRDMKSVIKEEAPDYKRSQQHEYDMAKIRAQATNTSIEKAKDRAATRQLAIDKGELVGKNDPLYEALTKEKVKIGGAANISGAINEDGNVDQNTDINKMLSQEYLIDDNELAERQTDWILESLITLSPDGENGNQKYSIKLGKETVTGSLDKIKNALLYTDDDDQLTNREAIQKIYDQQAAIIADNYKIKSEHPGGLNNYKKLYDAATGAFGITNRKVINERNLLTASKTNKSTYDLTRQEARQDTNIKKMMDKGGMPDIYDETSSVPRILSKEEYINNVVEGIENKEITNIDQSGFTWDDGTSNKDYMIDAYDEVFEMHGNSGSTTRVPRYNKDGSRAKMIDMIAVNSEAGKVYDALYSTHNAGLVGGNHPVATYQSIKKGLDNTVANLGIHNTYKSNIDPKIPMAAGNKMMSILIDQVAALEAKGIQPTYILGNLNEEADIDENNPLAKKALDLFKADLINWYNPKSSNTGSIQPRAEMEYSNTYGDPEDLEKNTAGNFIKYNASWLASKAKGAQDNQIGALTTTEIGLLQDGVSIIFPQNEDISPRSLANVNTYVSPITSEIMASPNGYIERNPISSDSISTGRYRFVKLSDKHYQYNYQMNTYQPGGTYQLSEVKTKQIPIKPGAEGNYTLERFEAEVINTYNILGEKNIQDALKDNAINGIK